MGGRLFMFAATGKVTDITNLKASEISLKPVLAQVKEKVAVAVEAVEEAIRPKAKRGRKPKASAE